MSRERADEVWLVLPGRFSARLFVDTGIVDGLRDALAERVVPVVLGDEGRVAHWLPRLGEPRLLRSDVEGTPRRVDRVLRALDDQVERQLGTYPLAVRFNRRHGFLVERMRPGHPTPYLNESLRGALPEWRVVERLARRWTFSPHRALDRRLRACFRERCGVLVLGTVQWRRVSPLMTAARRYRRPVVGHIASWDHTVGKGVISPHLDRYLVQNTIMRDDLVRYHAIPPERIDVTGWPLTDVFARPVPRADYEQLLRDAGLDPARPVVLYAGNVASNTPTEGALVERLLAWRRERGVGVIVRPHPNDTAFRERFSMTPEEGVHYQEPSFSDLDVLATLLQHVDCVVANAGTVLLDAIVNDRPAVCVLYDEGAPDGRFAELNVTGHHYRDLVESGAFYRAESFPELTQAIERALASPQELAAERARVARRVVGEVDGRAAGRVVEAILRAVSARDAAVAGA